MRGWAPMRDETEESVIRGGIHSIGIALDQQICREKPWERGTGICIAIILDALAERIHDIRNFDCGKQLERQMPHTGGEEAVRGAEEWIRSFPCRQQHGGC